METVLLPISLERNQLVNDVCSDIIVQLLGHTMFSIATAWMFTQIKKSGFPCIMKQGVPQVKETLFYEVTLSVCSTKMPVPFHVTKQKLEVTRFSISTADKHSGAQLC